MVEEVWEIPAFVLLTYFLVPGSVLLYLVLSPPGKFFILKYLLCFSVINFQFVSFLYTFYLSAWNIYPFSSRVLSLTSWIISIIAVLKTWPNNSNIRVFTRFTSVDCLLSWQLVKFPWLLVCPVLIVSQMFLLLWCLESEARDFWVIRGLLMLLFYQIIILLGLGHKFCIALHGLQPKLTLDCGIGTHWNTFHI